MNDYEIAYIAAEDPDTPRHEFHATNIALIER